MKYHVIFLITALALAVPAWADGMDRFTVAGKVNEVRCFILKGELPLTKVYPPVTVRCEVVVEVETDEEPFETVVNCGEPDVIEACQWLREGDSVLILGTEKATHKEASHVALWLDFRAVEDGSGVPSK